MEKDISHLTSEQIDTLMQRYYNGESTKKLLDEYNISVRPAELYKLFPPKVYPDYTCSYCGSSLISNRPSKSAIKNYSQYTENKAQLYCPNCGHYPFVLECSCSKCLEQKHLIQMRQIEQIKITYSERRIPIDFADISFENKVFLGALCRALLKENLYEVAPHQDSNVILTPTAALTKNLYNNLIDERIITVSPQSPLNAFKIDSKDFPNVFYIYKVTYLLNLSFPDNKQDLFEKILNPCYYSSEHANEALELWKKIAVAECIEYLEYQLTKVGFQFASGDKTYKMFEILLNDFSVSQIYGIIWKAVADASKLYLEKRFNKNHAANTVIGACTRYAERAKDNGWNLTSYNRIKDLPQSTLSWFYFYRVLDIGNMGFTVPPTSV